MSFKPHRLPFTLFLGGLAAIPPLSIDMGLPAFPEAQSALSASAQEIALTISVFLLGFATGPLVLGPMSDRYGRRPVLIAGLIVFSLGGLGCAFSTSIDVLLLLRLVQGVGAGAGGVLPFAIVRDLFHGHAARMRMSAVTTVLGVGPIVAPILGAALMEVGGWRMIYAVLGAGGLALLLVTVAFFAESAPAEKRHPMSLRHMCASYIEVLRNRTFSGCAVVNAAAFSVMFAYIAGSPAVMMGNLGASSAMFSMLFACSAAAFMVGSVSNSLMVGRSVTSGSIALLAITCMAIGSLGILILTMTGSLGQFGFAALAALSILGCGMIGPSMIHDALHPMGGRAGIASAAFRFIQMAIAAVASAMVGILYDGQSALGLGAVMIGASLVAMIAYALFLRIHQAPETA